jgi:Rv0078B-related antitoxin
LAVSRRELTIDTLAREQIDAARRRAPAEKLRDGLRLFERTCRMMEAGIRHERPGASPAEILQLIRQRLRLARELETR